MIFISKLKLGRGKSSSHSSSDIDSQDSPAGKEKGVQATSQIPTDIASDEALDQDAQAGVQRMQALATVWSKSNLIAAYVMYVSHSILISEFY